MIIGLCCIKDGKFHYCSGMWESVTVALAAVNIVRTLLSASAIISGFPGTVIR